MDKTYFDLFGIFLDILDGFLMLIVDNLHTPIEMYRYTHTAKKISSIHTHVDIITCHRLDFNII